VDWLHRFLLICLNVSLWCCSCGCCGAVVVGGHVLFVLILFFEPYKLYKGI